MAIWRRGVAKNSLQWITFLRDLCCDCRLIANLAIASEIRRLAIRACLFSQRIACRHATRTQAIFVQTVAGEIEWQEDETRCSARF
jgi:hypothetical protein